jgi:hypothetical protein
VIFWDFNQLLRAIYISFHPCRLLLFPSYIFLSYPNFRVFEHPRLSAFSNSRRCFNPKTNHLQCFRSYQVFATNNTKSKSSALSYKFTLHAYNVGRCRTSTYVSSESPRLELLARKLIFVAFLSIWPDFHMFLL